MINLVRELFSVTDTKTFIDTERGVQEEYFASSPEVVLNECVSYFLL